MKCCCNLHVSPPPLLIPRAHLTYLVGTVCGSSSCSFDLVTASWSNFYSSTLFWESCDFCLQVMSRGFFLPIQDSSQLRFVQEQLQLFGTSQGFPSGSRCFHFNQGLIDLFENGKGRHSLARVVLQSIRLCCRLPWKFPCFFLAVNSIENNDMSTKVVSK